MYKCMLEKSARFARVCKQRAWVCQEKVRNVMALNVSRTLGNKDVKQVIRCTRLLWPKSTWVWKPQGALYGGLITPQRPPEHPTGTAGAHQRPLSETIASPRAPQALPRTPKDILENPLMPSGSSITLML